MKTGMARLYCGELAGKPGSSTNAKPTEPIPFGSDRECYRITVSVYRACPSEERLAVHWMMLLAAFPLFRDLCGVVGKLASIQDEFSTSQINRRIFELWGERSTLVHSLSKNIKTLKEFGAIRQRRPGYYERVRKPIRDDRVIEFMLCGMIKCEQKLYQSITEFERQKELFPFEFEANLEHLVQSKQLKLDRVGGELVASI